MSPRLWMTAAVAFTAVAAAWLRSPTAVALGAAAVLATALLRRGRSGGRAARRRRGLVAGGAWLFVAVAAWHQRALAAIGADPTGAVSAAAAVGVLRAAVQAEGVRLERLVSEALRAPADRRQAFARLERALPGDLDRALVLVEDGRPHAWAGRLLVSLDSVTGPRGLLVTPYHLVLAVAARDGRRVAVATTLLHAARPATALTRALDEATVSAQGLAGFAYGPPDVGGALGTATLSLGDLPIATVRAVPLGPDARRLAAEERTLPWAVALLGLVVFGVIATAWRRGGSPGERVAAWGLAVGALAAVPTGGLSNQAVAFDPSVFFVAAGGPFTANAASVALASALLLLAMLTAVRGARWRPSRPLAFGLLALVAVVGPFALRALAAGIRLPMSGAGVPLWIAWQVAFFLAATVVLLPGVIVGRRVIGAARGLPVWTAPAIASLAAASAPWLLDAPGRLPPWHPLLWVVAIAALGLSRRGRALILPVAFVAACGATTVVWLATTRDRVALAEADLRGLDVADPMAATLLRQAADALDRRAAARSRPALLDAFVGTALAATDYPVEITTWGRDGVPLAELRVRRGPGVTRGIERFAQEVQGSGAALLEAVPGDPGVHLVLAAPHDDGTATTIVVAPRSGLVAPDAFGAFLGFAPPPTPEPPYTLRVPAASAAEGPAAAAGTVGWTRRGPVLHGDWAATSPAGLPRVHAEVELRAGTPLLLRGALLVLLDLLLIAGLWLVIVIADGVLRRWWRRRRRDLLRSFRVRLSLALFLACSLPALFFGGWTVQRLQLEDAQARDLLVRETLRGVALSTASTALREASLRFDTPLFLYADGVLVATSDPVLDALAPVGRLLPPGIALALADGDDPVRGEPERLGRTRLRLGYRAAADAAGATLVLAAPARLDDRLLDRRRNDLAVFLLFALSVGALVALGVSGAGARQLSEPIRQLRSRVLAVARGAPLPESGAPPIEFVPVFRAFSRMTVDLAESRAELEAAQRRLEATLRNVASGVLAIDGEGRVTVANPRAETILGRPVTPGAAAAEALGPALWGWVEGVRAASVDEGATELDRDGRRLQLRATRLGAGGRRLVLTLDDVTDVARAERVLAWGEMARQVAHEIKNPLTPMRLGVQHLRRAHRDGRGDFDAVLEANTARMLTEIDRLDELARTFSRYGVVPDEAPPPVTVDAAAVVRDVLDLERIGAEGIAWVAEGAAAPVWVAARERELREVLLNLLENARLAGARKVVVTLDAVPAGGAMLHVTDDGEGIAPSLLPRIFEPRFSTRSSGSGLGLAMARRVLERWGGRITAESVVGRGTTIHLTMGPPPPPE